MIRVILIVFVVLVVLAAAGIIVPMIYRAREDADMARCQNNLRDISSSLLYSALPGQAAPPQAQGYFPPGTIVVADLEVDRRLSWYPLILAAAGQAPAEPGLAPKKPLRYADILGQIDATKPWDADVHRIAAHTQLAFAVCPASPPDSGNGPALTNYLGNGGIGANTAALPLDQAGKDAGVFRYDAPTPLEAIRQGDGLANSIAVVESAHHLGPWLRGGPATVRSLDPPQPPYLGLGRPYAGCHRGRGNFAFADGSVRTLIDETDPNLFRALLTIQGHEKTGD